MRCRTSISVSATDRGDERVRAGFGDCSDSRWVDATADWSRVGYRLEAVDAGTKVTLYYDSSDIHEQYSALAAEHFPIISATNLRSTLGILVRRVASGAERPGA
jgi:hypothetical protein